MKGSFRAILPEDAFVNRKLDDIRLKIISKKPSDSNSKAINGSMQGRIYQRMLFDQCYVTKLNARTLNLSYTPRQLKRKILDHEYL